VFAGVPGGVIFPLFFAAAALARGASGFWNWVGAAADPLHDPTGALQNNFGPITTVCLMAALQAATTRTPLATVLILAMASAPSADNTAALLPAMAAGAYVGVWTAELFGVSFFDYPK